MIRVRGFADHWESPRADPWTGQSGSGIPLVVGTAWPWDHRDIVQSRPSPADRAPAPPRDPDPASDHQPGRHVRRLTRSLRGPLRRSRDDRFIGGVAGGLAQYTGRSATLFRAIFVVLAVFAGSGLALYVLAWLLIPRSGSSVPIARRALSDRESLAYAVAFATGLVGLLLALDALGLTFASNLIWPNWLAVAGLVVVWRSADEDEKADLRELIDKTPLVGVSATQSRRATVARVVLGIALVVVGLTGLVATRHPTFATLRSLGAACAVLVGFIVVFGPWWLRLVRDLTDERRERVRTQERADMAAHVHDSVLQTLALIQRSASNPREVTRLARVQERELRAWLFEGR
ncbi:MAG TPA: PspC domain-containing protein, partial [Acidimicrobiales bacterium]|nr:PspC domain-containing protein [Acidimicrobiales bacterium]